MTACNHWIPVERVETVPSGAIDFDDVVARIGDIHRAGSVDRYTPWTAESTPKRFDCAVPSDLFDCVIARVGHVYVAVGLDLDVLWCMNPLRSVVIAPSTAILLIALLRVSAT